MEVGFSECGFSADSQLTLTPFLRSWPDPTEVAQLEREELLCRPAGHPLWLGPLTVLLANVLAQTVQSKM
jgi:hypothetical protein